MVFILKIFRQHPMLLDKFISKLRILGLFDPGRQILLVLAVQTQSVDNECYQLLEGNSETKNDWTLNLQERSTRFRSCPWLLGMVQKQSDVKISNSVT